ncbi:hypothetical protein RI685_16710 (plasmid) [Clavibacter michiganensis]|uniref:hypothetical protein n=1 Tax=Clavibacter michiganensis TaxID=28447 RepID=UPI003DA1C32D
MIVANLRKSYREVLTGQRDMDDATLGWWAGITDEAAARYGDVIVGVFNNRVVSVFDTSGYDRDEDGRIFFDGNESTEFEHMIGKPSPVKPWVRGQARPIQYIDTDIVRDGDATVVRDGRHLRAVVAGYVLTVDGDGIATVEPPEGGVVIVTAAGSNGRVLEMPLK